MTHLKSIALVNAKQEATRGKYELKMLMEGFVKNGKMWYMEEYSKFPSSKE